MTLVQQTIPGLYNGVSQQPPTLRLLTQGEKQINAVGDIVRGLYKRPPTEYKDSHTKLNKHNLVHEIHRDPSEQYIVFFTDDDTDPIVIWDVVNEEFKSVDYGHLDEDLEFTSDGTVKDYLTFFKSSVPAQKRIRAATVADYTIVANTQQTPKMEPETTDPKENVAVVEIRGWYDDRVEVKLNGSKTSSTSVDAAESGNDEVMVEVEQLLHNLGNVVTHKVGNLLMVRMENDSEFSLDVSGADTYVYFRSVPSYGDLWPASTFSEYGEKVRILQNQYGEGVHYYVESDGENWTETVGFDQETKMDEDTLPHRLVRMEDGSFVFAPIDWAKREVGDEDSAPTPSFIDQNIQNVFFYQNRLGFLTRDTVVMGRADRFFAFWPRTALDVLDDDPIDVGVATSEITVLREIIPFNKNMLLRADHQQFILSYSGGMLSPQTVAIDQSTRFATIPMGRSTSAGSTLYFVCPNQNHATLREYFVQPDSMVEDAADVTRHVPTYIPYHDTIELKSATPMDYVFVRSGESPENLYVFKFFWQGEEKAQNAWSHWTFGDDIIGFAVFGSDLYVMFDVDGTGVISRVRLNAEPRDTVHLDKKVKLSGNYYSGENKTEFQLPYIDPDDNFMVIDPDTFLGFASVEKNKNSDIVKVEGDHTDKEYYVGQKYNMVYEITPWYLKDRQGNVQIGTLKLRSITVAFADTGFFELVVKSRKNPAREHRIKMSGFLLGSSETDEATFQDNEIRYAVIGETKDLILRLENNSQLSSIFQTVTNEGFFHSRAEIM